MDWIQWFRIYIAVVSCAKPNHVADLITYLNPIINSQRQFQDFNWALYDHQFWQKAATTPSLQWGTMEGTLWNLSCLNRSTRPSFSARLFPSTPSTIKVPICLEWNEDPHEGCPILTVVTSMFATAVSMSLLSLTIPIKLFTVQINKRNQLNQQDKDNVDSRG